MWIVVSKFQPQSYRLFVAKRSQFQDNSRTGRNPPLSNSNLFLVGWSSTNLHENGSANRRSQKRKTTTRKEAKKREERECVRSSGSWLTLELLYSPKSRAKDSPLWCGGARERLENWRKVKRKGGVAARGRRRGPWRGSMVGSSPRTRSRCNSPPLPSPLRILPQELAEKKKPTYSVSSVWRFVCEWFSLLGVICHKFTILSSYVLRPTERDTPNVVFKI
jgi:hypothetical protein